MQDREAIERIAEQWPRNRIAGALFLLRTLLVPDAGVLGQTSPMPDVIPGPTFVEYHANTREYVFHCAGVDYKYSIAGGGSFRALTVLRNGEEFYPALDGGVEAELQGAIRQPWSADGQRNLVYRLLDSSLANGTVTVSWSMRYGNDSTRFTIGMRPEGQILILDIAGDESGRTCGIGFARSSPAENTKVVHIPYLTLCSVLYRKSSGSFVSIFADWEQTSASSITPWLDRQSTSSGYYSQRVEYERTTAGRRNVLRERVYLSVAGDLQYVLPNVVGPTAPFVKELAGRIVLSYGRFFPWILRAPPEDPTPRYLDGLTDAGVRDLAIIVKDWSRGQFDHNYPCTWPPDDYQRSACWGGGVAGSGEGGVQGLRLLRDAVRSKGYFFALHENYTDYHASGCALASVLGPGEYRGLLPDGRPAKTFFNDCRDHPSQAWLLKPSKIDRVARWSMGEIARGLGGTRPIDWSYLDVSSAVNPSGPVSWDRDRSYVDFDSASPDAGKFTGTVKWYRYLPSIARSVYGGPVQGEGTNHFLYAGYFDSFEGRLVTAADGFAGEEVPLLLDFDLVKLHGRSVYHGVGHIQQFFGSGNSAHERISEDEILEYIATELAFGHAGLVTKAVLRDYDHSTLHASLEQRFGLPIERMCDTSRVTSLGYFDAGGSCSASEYIARHVDGFDDFHSSEFMGKIKVVYANGVEVFVNRTGQPWTVTLDTPSGGWYTYHVSVNGRLLLGTGAIPGASVVLPAKNGWAAFLPHSPSQ